jgi:hypothetical protein
MPGLLSQTKPHGVLGHFPAVHWCRLTSGVAKSPAESASWKPTSFHKSSQFSYLMVDMSPEDAVFPKSQEANKLLQFKNESIY